MPKKGSPKKSKAAASKPRTKKSAAPKQAPAPLIHQPLPSSLAITKEVLFIIRSHWRTLTGIVLVYFILNIIFASGLSNLSSAVATIKTDFDNSAGGSHTLAKGISGFGTLIGSGGASGSSSASVLQSSLFIIESLVIIWALRQLLAGKTISVKEAYYHSMYPLIPFLLVIGVIILQLLPLSLGVIIVNAVLTSAVSSVAIAAWLSWIFFLGLAAWSFYMLSSSIFALYIVTLPEMQPRQALKSARNLVLKRRWSLVPKIIYLPVFILVVMGIIIVPLIILASVVVAPVFYFLSMLVVLFIHSYLYALYRKLLV
jgi:hypothetical protein